MPGARLRFTTPGQPLTLGMAARYEIAAEDEANDALKLGMLGSYEFGGWLFGANLNYENPEGENDELGYAVAMKNELRHHLSMGLEVAGSFEEEKSGEVIAGVYWEATHQFQVNIGLGTGFNSETDFTAKTALIWTF